MAKSNCCVFCSVWFVLAAISTSWLSRDCLHLSCGVCFPIILSMTLLVYRACSHVFLCPHLWSFSHSKDHDTCAVTMFMLLSHSMDDMCAMSVSVFQFLWMIRALCLWSFSYSVYYMYATYVCCVHVWGCFPERWILISVPCLSLWLFPHTMDRVCFYVSVAVCSHYGSSCVLLYLCLWLFLHVGHDVCF